MNNLTIISIVWYLYRRPRYYSESPLAIYQVACWFLSSKIQLVLSVRCFLQIFPPELLGKHFSSFWTFYSEWKRWKSLDARSGKYGGVSRTKSLNPIFFFLLDSCWIRPCVIKEKQNYSATDVFLKDFHAHFSFLFQMAADSGCVEVKR